MRKKKFEPVVEIEERHVETPTKILQNRTWKLKRGGYFEGDNV
jgi:hypothetical protein